MEIKPNVTFAIGCYAENSILKLLGFGSQSTIIRDNAREAEYLIFTENEYIQAKLPPLLKHTSNMHVYTDIAELSAVGNSQVPIMGYLPVKTNF